MTLRSGEGFATRTGRAAPTTSVGMVTMVDQVAAATRSLSRRTFVKAVGGAGVGFALYVYLPDGTTRALATLDTPGALHASDIPKFRTPMLVPPVMPRAGTLTLRGGKPADYYEISVRQISQQILPPELPETTVWGYGAVRSQSRRGLQVHNAPSLTIEAQHDRPVRVKWTND